MARSTSMSSALGQYHPESYPDTEEELEDFASSDTETDASGTKHTKHSIKHHHHHHPHHHHPHHLHGTVHGKTPTGSVAASPASGRHLIDEHSKGSQNLSIDNLQESLKRSLGISKWVIEEVVSRWLTFGFLDQAGSEASHSPAAASSIGSMADMVKRTFITIGMLLMLLLGHIEAPCIGYMC